MSTITKAEQLREELMTVLEHDQLDYDQLQKLSGELAKLEPSSVRFSVDAGLISRLGRELVARQETAVAELVKNAYDADAREVTLVFSEVDVPGGRLEIRDDGLGMTREQLINGFMRLSSSEKIEYPTSPRYKRQRAGRKGIGRFAVQRLGRKLTIRTQTKNSPIALEVVIDWDAFVVGLDLTAVTSRIYELPKQQEEGTTLSISGLQEAWDEPSIRRVYRYVSDLLQPFPLSDTKASSRYDPGFKIALYREHEGQITVVADEETEIFSHALAEIEGYVDAKGHGYWSVRSGKLELDDRAIPVGKGREKRDKPFRVLRNVEFKAYYFIYLTEFIPRSLNKTIRELAERKGGIRVYRNGFRVSPYGDPDDDWLGLDASYRRRSHSLLDPIGNKNFFGFIEITDSQGELFEETSSREGLIENAAFEELQDFVSKVLKSAALRVAEAREKNQANSQDEQKDDPGIIVTQAYKALEKTARELVRAGQTGQAKTLKQVSKQLQVAVATQTERTETLIEELAMLRVLASLGQTIGEFTHEVRQSLNPAQADANWLRDHLTPKTPEQTAAERLSMNIRGFKTHASYFDRAVADNTSRAVEPQDVQLVIRQFLEVIGSSAQRSGIEVDMDVQGYDLYTRPMHASEWTSVLFNLFTNARKAIDRAGVKGKILLRAGRENGRVFLEFADNGDGIAPENEDHIFNAFFTTSSPAGHRASEVDEARGTGLGLKIVYDIASSYGGNVFLVSPPEGYSTCFKLEVPAAREEDLEAYDV